MNSKIAAAVLAAAGILAAAYYFGGHNTPRGQRPLVYIGAGGGEESLDALKSEFNAAAAEFRVILLLSPT